MTRQEADRVERRVERKGDGMQVTGRRVYDHGARGKSYSVEAVDTRTGYPLVIDDPRWGLDE